MVGIEQTWSDPEHLSEAVGNIRQKVLATQYPCLCVVVPKAAVMFPQVWDGKPKHLWGFGEHPGVFVQLESAGDEGPRRIWFLEERKKGLQDGVMLDEKVMCVIDPLYWTEKIGKQQEQAQSVQLSSIDADAGGAAYKRGGKNKGGKSRGGKCSKGSAFGGH